MLKMLVSYYIELLINRLYHKISNKTMLTLRGSFMCSVSGNSTAMESFINGELGKNTTALIAIISLVVGTIFFLISIIVTGDLKSLININDINPKHYL